MRCDGGFRVEVDGDAAICRNGCPGGDPVRGDVRDGDGLRGGDDRFRAGHREQTVEQSAEPVGLFQHCDDIFGDVAAGLLGEQFQAKAQRGKWGAQLV